jgi:hypothetical protein
LTHIRALDATPITRNESICRIRHTEGLSNYEYTDDLFSVCAYTHGQLSVYAYSAGFSAHHPASIAKMTKCI